jgi:DNA-binding response OmpR family regulator
MEIENNNKPKILLLEDYPDFLEFYRRRLIEAGFAVTVESDENHGLHSAMVDKPDLIILDISLPQAEDFGFIKEIKKHLELADVPVIVLTDLSSQESVDEGLAVGASEYLVRNDFTFAQVIDKIKEVINHKSMKA